MARQSIVKGDYPVYISETGTRQTIFGCTYINETVSGGGGGGGTPASPNRILKLFEGYKIKFVSGKIILYQK